MYADDADPLGVYGPEEALDIISAFTFSFKVVPNASE
jgi:hypothetical protein